MANRDALIKEYNAAKADKQKVYEDLVKIREALHMVANPAPDAEKKFRAAEKAYAEADKKVVAIKMKLAS